MKLHLRYLIAAAIVAAPLGAAADKPTFRADGSVKVGKKIFATHNAWVNSPLFKASQSRCASVKPPPVAEASPGDCSLSHTTINPEYNDNRTFIIPVVFHNIRRTDGTGAISTSLINSQIDILNEDFQALTGTPGEGGANTRIRFVLAKRDPAGNPTTGINVVTNNSYFDDGPGMKQALHWDTTRFLNVYTNTASGALGYATFPAVEAGGEEDGVVVLWSAVGRDAPIGPPYDQGRTLTHEVGHWLGLYHTFQDGCAGGSQYDNGDLIADTVREQSPHFGCTPGPSSCGGGNNPIDNYMDYSDDTCMDNFSVEQSNRIRCSLWNYRTINTAPTADFTYVATNLQVAFTDTSTDPETPTTLYYNWTFGDGGTSTMADPSHTYGSAGTYTVTLLVTDPMSGESTASDMVMVVGGGTPDAAPAPPDAPPGTPDAAPGTPDGDPGPGTPDAPGNPSGPDADGGDGGDGGGCCQAQADGGASFALCAFPVAFLLVRRRRRAR